MLTQLAYRVPDAAKAVGLTETQIWELIREKRIAAIRLVGRRILIERDELAAFVARERKPAR
jgi:excisionase family DNA binding protein